MKAPAWSFSSLTLFETCPRKYQAEKVTKEIKFVETEQVKYGKRVHTIAEEYIRDGKDIPAAFEFMRPHLDGLLGLPGDKYCEVRFGIKQVDGKLEPCDFFDKQVWFRGQADLIIVNKRKAFVVDYKTGKNNRSDPRQLALMAAAVFLKFPEVETVKSCLLYVVHDAIVPVNYGKEERFKIFSELDTLLHRREEAYASNVWNPTPNGLCSRWCPVVDCLHNGR